MIAFSLAMALALAVQAQPAAPSGGQSEVGKAEAEALLAGCGGRRFETPVEIAAEGRVRRSKVKLCGKAGQSDADWVRTLEDAVRNVDNSRMPPAAKEQVIAALRAEIGRLVQAMATAAPLPDPAPGPVQNSPTLRNPATPVTAPTTAPARPVVPAAAILAGPRVSFRCLTPGEGGEAKCNTLDRDGFLIVFADEELEAGHRLRFVRRGDVRSTIALAPMARGKSVRLKLPGAVCAGVVSSRLEVQLLGRAAETVVQTLGPLSLRC